MPGNQEQSRQLTAQGKAHQAPAQEISLPPGIPQVAGKPQKALRVRLLTADVCKHVLI